MSDDRPLRILHLTAGSDAGGLSRYIHDLCQTMHNRGHRVAVAGQHGAWHDLFESAPFPWIDAPLKGGLLALRKSARDLIHWIASNPIDLIQTHYRRCTLVARRIQKQLRIPILYTVHQPGISLQWGRRFFSDFGDVTHVPSEEARDWLIQEAHLDPGKIALIHHGIKTENYPIATDEDRLNARRAFNIASDATVAGFVGRFDVPKNEDWILDVATAARKQLPHAHFVLAGEGPHLPEIQRRIRGQSLTNITLTTARGALPIYQASDAVLVPSLREGFSLVTAEAMCVGRPVLRTRTGGCTALIRENVTGRSCPIDRDQFIAASLEFLRDRASLRQMSPACSSHIRANFTYPRQVDQTIDLYHQMIDKR